MPPIRRIGVLTGGGDCPGLNAVIRAVTKDALFHGIEVVGILDGFLGLIQDRVRLLDADAVSGILTVGGTILGTSNKANPRRFAVASGPGGAPVFKDMTADVLATIDRHRLDAVVVIGGDGTHSAAAPLMQQGVPFLGVPKTIDNDIVGTELTFGFLTAVATATDALDKIHTTAASHSRVMVVEVMGRNAGWIALSAGVAGGADVILLPEIPFDKDGLKRALDARAARGRRFHIICAAEGAAPAGGAKLVARHDPASPDPLRLGGIGKFVADLVETDLGIEARYAVLGHVQRGGSPIAADRVLATQFGHHAMQLLRAGQLNRMVAMQAGRLTSIPLAEVADRQRTIPPDDPLLAAARSVYTSFAEP